MKAKTSLMIAYAILALFAVGIVSFGWWVVSNLVADSKYNQQEHVVSVEAHNTDIQTLRESFPSIGEIEECYWYSDVTNKDFLFGGIGPTVYWLNGYMRISAAETTRLLSEYQWQKPETYSKHFSAIESQIKNADGLSWLESEEFSTGFTQIGNFYFDPQNRLILFDLQRE